MLQVSTPTGSVSHYYNLGIIVPRAYILGADEYVPKHLSFFDKDGAKHLSIYEKDFAKNLSIYDEYYAIHLSYHNAYVPVYISLKVAKEVIIVIDKNAI